MEFVHLHATMDARVTRSRTSRAEDMAARCTRSKRLLRDVTALLALSPPPQQQKRARTARRGLGAPDSDAGPTAASPSAREAACSGMEVDVRRVAYAAAADDGGATRNSGAAPRGGNGARGGGGRVRSSAIARVVGMLDLIALIAECLDLGAIHRVAGACRMWRALLDERSPAHRDGCGPRVAHTLRHVARAAGVVTDELPRAGSLASAGFGALLRMRLIPAVAGVDAAFEKLRCLKDRASAGRGTVWLARERSTNHQMLLKQVCDSFATLRPSVLRVGRNHGRVRPTMRDGAAEAREGGSKTRGRRRAARLPSLSVARLWRARRVCDSHAVFVPTSAL